MEAQQKQVTITLTYDRAVKVRQSVFCRMEQLSQTYKDPVEKAHEILELNALYEALREAIWSVERPAAPTVSSVN